jgi:hypothetical protein
MQTPEVTRRRRESLVVSLWMLAWLIAIDIGVNLAFSPKGNQLPGPGLQRYFEYGRSIEGKLARGAATQNPILSAGWINPEELKKLPDRPRDGADVLVATYGQSFTMNAVLAAAALDTRMTVRAVGGPGAPPNHSYAAYVVDVPLRKADVVVFGVLSSTIGQMGSLSGLISMFENPAPFTYPRYRLDGGRLVGEQPVIGSEAAFRSALDSRSEEWRRFKQQLRHSDRGYSRVTFDDSFADSSSIVRLLRRGWVAHRQSYDEGVYVPGKGFDPEAEDVKVLQALLVDLAQQTRLRGERLIVLLLHTKGHGDHLHAVLEGTLKKARIEYVSTHSHFSANDPGNFVRDGHYTDTANGKLSKALLELIRRPNGGPCNGRPADVAGPQSSPPPGECRKP